MNMRMVLDVAILAPVVLGGCAALGLKSQPWPTYTPTLDEKAMSFMRSVPKVEAGMLGRSSDYGQDKREIGIAVTGGGMRAAAHTLGVLQGLQDIGAPEPSRVLESVDFVSTNSGGGWGVAAYMADRARHGSSDYKLGDRRAAISESFDAMSKGKVRCLPEVIETNLTYGQDPGKGLTYGEIFNGPASHSLPDHYINAALLPSEAAFVFNQAYLDHYRIRSFGACKDRYVADRLSGDGNVDLEHLPYAFAAAASGSVPLFYYTYAKTAICDPASEGEENSFYDSSFCSLGKRKADQLHIVDGGIHDNHAVETAFEVMASLPDVPAGRRSMIFVDSTTNTANHTHSSATKRLSFYKLAAGFGTGSGFAGQDATVVRMRKSMFEALGADVFVLDFFAAANLDAQGQALLENEEFARLRNFARDEVYCFDHKGELLKGVDPKKTGKRARLLRERRRKADDCQKNNAYRAGTIAKTTYKYDEKMFDVLWELGLFTVRLHEDNLLRMME